MRQDQFERLQVQRDTLATAVQKLLDTPECERPTAPKVLKSWLRDLTSAQNTLAQLDGMLLAAQKALQRQTRRETPRARPAPSADQGESLVLARIPQSASYELRVALRTWQGRRSVDLRSYWLKEPGVELPTKRGMRVDVDRLPALLEALKLAQQHV